MAFAIIRKSGRLGDLGGLGIGCFIASFMHFIYSSRRVSRHRVHGLYGSMRDPTMAVNGARATPTLRISHDCGKDIIGTSNCTIELYRCIRRWIASRVEKVIVSLPNGTLALDPVCVSISILHRIN